MTILLAVTTAATAWAASYVTDVMVIGGQVKNKVNAMKVSYLTMGWNLIDYDLNKGCGAYSDYIYLLYKTGFDKSKAITDFFFYSSQDTPPSTISRHGRTYRLANYDGDDSFKESAGDLNHHAQGDYIFLYYTDEQFPNSRAVTGLSVNTSSDGALEEYSLNAGTSGETMYLHVTTEEEAGIGQQPYKCFDTCTGGGCFIYVEGWAFDADMPDASLYGRAYVYTDANCTNLYKSESVTFDCNRPDVNKTYSKYNLDRCHGLKQFIEINDAGTYYVKVAAFDATGNANVLLSSNGTSVKQATVTGYTEINSSNAPVEWTTGTYKVTSNVEISSRITVSGDVTVWLGKGTTLTAPEGIAVPAHNSLTINGTGALTAKAQGLHAAIGGTTHSEESSSQYGHITINGGTINAKGGKKAAAIGGGFQSHDDDNSCSITINDGVIFAEGGSLGCAIGSGYFGGAGSNASGTICINGGQITAKTNVDNWGIGQTWYPECTSGPLTLGWTHETDFISAPYFRSPNISFVEGNTFITEDNNRTATADNIGRSCKLIPKISTMDHDMHYAIVNGLNGTYRYSGKVVTITPKLTDVNSNALAEGTHYTTTLTYKGSPVTEAKDAGRYTYTFTTIDGCGYSGSRVISFTVYDLPPAPTLRLTSYTANSATFEWTENGQEDDWEMEFDEYKYFTHDGGSSVYGWDHKTPTVTVTDMEAGKTYYGRVRSTDYSYDHRFSDWSNMVAVPTTNTVIEGNQSMNDYTKIPTELKNKYSLSQQIYTAAELGAAGFFESVSFTKTVPKSWPGSENRQLDVYMVYTDKSGFDSDTDWIQVSESDKVFSGNVTINGDWGGMDGWTTLTLDKPFFYNGMQNIAIIIDDNTGAGWDNDDLYINQLTFACIKIGAQNQAICYTSNDTNLNPTDNLATAGTRLDRKNWIHLGRTNSANGIILSDYADNGNAISTAATNGGTTLVTYNDRTFYKNGEWNTLCLPFDLTITGSVLEGAEARSLSGATLTKGKLTLNFSNPVNKLLARVPYIIRWNTDDMMIRSESDWDAFAAKVNSGTESYEGKMVRLAKDISVTTMVGTEEHPFQGTFDGEGHTLDVSIDASSTTCAAPFRAVGNATIRNLVVTGSVVGSTHCSGLVGKSFNCLIENCDVRTDIDCRGTHCGGLLGHSHTMDATIRNCRFDGSITGAKTAIGIIFGWGDKPGVHTVENCLAKGTYRSADNIDLLMQHSGTQTVTNCYKTQIVGSQGTYTTEWGGALAMWLGNGWEVIDREVLPKKVTVRNVMNPVFPGATIAASTPASIDFDGGQFIGTYSPVSFNADDKNSLLIGSTGKLGSPTGNVTLGSFRAYFTVNPGNFGDVDGNGQVDDADLTALTDYLTGKVAAPSAPDVNGDRKVDIADVATLISIIVSPQPITSIVSNVAGISLETFDGKR